MTTETEKPVVEFKTADEIWVKTAGKKYRHICGRWDLWVGLPSQRWEFHLGRGTWRKVSGKNVLAQLNELKNAHVTGEQQS